MLVFLIGFRKFLMGGLFLLLTTWLLLMGMIPAVDWLQHTSTVVVAFMSTNVAESIISFAKEWVNGRKKS